MVHFLIANLLCYAVYFMNRQ